MFSEKLREARLKAGLTLAEAARRSGLSVGCWTRNERGISDPSVDVAFGLVAATGLDLDQLLGRVWPRHALAGDTFGRRLRAARERAGLTQDDLAAELDTDRGTVRKWESDVVLPRLKAAAVLADRLEVLLGELLGSEGVVGKVRSG